MIMFSYVLVGGHFNDQGGRESGYIRKLFSSMQAINSNGVLFNGGNFSQLSELINKNFFQVIFWMPDIPNDKEKLVNKIKVNNPRCILITSKNNLEQKYSLKELISRALSIKSNLFIEFTKIADRCINASIYDPLGNCFCTSPDIEQVALSLMLRVKELVQFKRINSAYAGPSIKIKETAELSQFLSYVRNYADKFHELIHPLETPRFLGNASFRCECGFPSFKTDNCVYISRRNIDKRNIDVNNFVPIDVSMSLGVLQYRGDFKPSVDSPIQLLLYNYYENIKYMLHSHTYIKNAPFTERVIPCGAIDEFYEIIKTVPLRKSEVISINLKGHGSLVMAKNVESFKEINYIARPCPEYITEL